MGMLWDVFCDLMDPMSFNVNDVQTDAERKVLSAPVDSDKFTREEVKAAIEKIAIKGGCNDA